MCRVTCSSQQPQLVYGQTDDGLLDQHTAHHVLLLYDDPREAFVVYDLQDLGNPIPVLCFARDDLHSISTDNAPFIALKHRLDGLERLGRHGCNTGLSCCRYRVLEVHK
jgi:hypothetical protein